MKSSTPQQARCRLRQLAPLLVPEPRCSDSNVSLLSLNLSMFRLLALLILYMLDFLRNELDLLQTHVNLLTQFVAEILIDDCLLVVDKRLERFGVFIGQIVSRDLLCDLHLLLLLFSLFAWFWLILLINIWQSNATQTLLIPEDPLADVLMTLLFNLPEMALLDLTPCLFYHILARVEHRILPF